MCTVYTLYIELFQTFQIVARRSRTDRPEAWSGSVTCRMVFFCCRRTYFKFQIGFIQSLFACSAELKKTTHLCTLCFPRALRQPTEKTPSIKKFPLPQFDSIVLFLDPPCCCGFRDFSSKALLFPYFPAVIITSHASEDQGI